MSETPVDHKLKGFDTTRIKALADGIFAFAMTLMVLDLKETLPKGADFSQLLHQLAQKLLYYVISFMILGLFWTGHHAEFHYINKTNRAHLWLNIFLLMCVAIIPYSASLLANSENRLFAVVVYSANMTITTAAYLLHWWYATKNNKLTIAGITGEIIWDVKKRLIVSNILLVLSLILSLWNTAVSLILYTVIQLYFIYRTTQTNTGTPTKD